MPLPNCRPNRYIVSPDVEDDRNQAGGRIDYQPERQAPMLGRYLWSHTKRLTPRTIQPADQLAEAKLQDIMLARHLHVQRERHQRGPLLHQQASTPTRGDRGPHRTPSTTSTSPTRTRWPSGLPSIVVAGFFTGGTSLGDSQQPFVQRNNDVYQFTDELHLLRGRHSWKFGVDVRREHMLIAFINRPNGDYTFSGAITGNAAGRLPARPARAVPRAPPSRRSRTATAGSTPASCRTSSG